MSVQDERLASSPVMLGIEGVNPKLRDKQKRRMRSGECTKEMAMRFALGLLVRHI
jgi:hypothetical protein